MAATWRRRLGRLRRPFRSSPPVPPPRRKIVPAPAPRPTDEEIGERRLATFRQILGAMPPGRLLDLGSGHGAFSLIGRELGWEVTAVDARTERMPMTDGIRWLQADVRTSTSRATTASRSWVSCTTWSSTTSSRSCADVRVRRRSSTPITPRIRW